MEALSASCRSSVLCNTGCGCVCSLWRSASGLLICIHGGAVPQVSSGSEQESFPKHVLCAHHLEWFHAAPTAQMSHPSSRSLRPACVHEAAGSLVYGPVHMLHAGCLIASISCD